MSIPDFTVRGSILEKAKSLTEGDRASTYGDVKKNLQKIATLWNAYLNNCCERNSQQEEKDLSPADVSNLLALMKIARIQTNINHTDSYVDACAYVAMAGECNEVQI